MQGLCRKSRRPSSAETGKTGAKSAGQQGAAELGTATGGRWFQLGADCQPPAHFGLLFVSFSCLLHDMKRKVAHRWQIVIPAEIRHRHNLRVGSRLEWIDDGVSIRIVPIPADPVEALTGHAKGERLLEKLLAARAEDRRREG
jgi:AbrB family looped-hinge helix DNA binding protein